MFDIKKTLEKGVRGAIAAGIAAGATYLATKGIVEITPEQQLSIVAIVMGLVASLTNLLKHKFPKIFGWL